MRAHYSPIRMDRIKNSDIIKGMKKLYHIYCWWERKMIQTLWEKKLAIS